jgi:hypothetical protein
MKLITVLALAAFYIPAYGVVFTQDVTIAKKEVEDKATVANYVSNTYNTLSKVNQTMSAVDNLKKLQGLQKLNGMSELCRLCDMSDLKQLQQYSSSIDSDLCSQFSIAYQNLTGITNSAKSLQDIMGLLTTNPQAAMLSLQQASLAASQTTNSTLAQMQTLQAQTQQRELAKEKMQQTTAYQAAMELDNSRPPL